MALRAISLFTGAGGLDFGIEAAGFHTAVAVELDGACCAFLRANRGRWQVIEGDIHEVSSRDILRAGKLRKKQADLLVGGPPCQPFSKSGYWARGDALRLADGRADTLSAYLRVLEETKPRAFLLENVSGLAYRGKAEGLNHLLDGIDKVNQRAGTNYKPSWKVLNAADYGVSQVRERIFLVGSRDGRPFEFPSPTHGSQTDGGLFSTNKREPHRTTWDAIGDLPASPDDEGLQVGGRWGNLLPSIPEGQNYLWHTNRGGGVPLFGWRRRYWNFLLKLAKNRPSWTIQAQPGTATGPFHWNNRRLSIPELCRLQTFPEALVFDCSRSAAQRLMGNAVPSLLVEILALEIRRQLLDDLKIRRRPSLLRPKCGIAPPPERVAGVAQRYREMIGDHSDHPGEGRGNRAVQQGRSSAQIPLL